MRCPQVTRSKARVPVLLCWAASAQFNAAHLQPAAPYSFPPGAHSYERLFEPYSMLEFVIIWILCGIGAGFVAINRGASGYLWFALGFLFGPFGLAVAFMAGKQATCGACRKRIHPEATKCPYCQTQQDALPRPHCMERQSPRMLDLPSKPFLCPTCGQKHNAGTMHCDCGRSFMGQ